MEYFFFILIEIYEGKEEYLWKLKNEEKNKEEKKLF